MGTGGTLIRLIDIVFILLFGFISISEINEKSQIELPKSSETPPSNPDKEQVIFVGIRPDGIYLLEHEQKMIGDPLQLFSYLQNKAAQAVEQGTEIRVRIRSNFDTPIKYTMAASDICDHLNIPKGIDVRRTSGFSR
ncbi:MAG: ExbD/TolR family protein [bacterium]